MYAGFRWSCCRHLPPLTFRVHTAAGVWDFAETADAFASVGKTRRGLAPRERCGSSVEGLRTSVPAPCPTTEWRLLCSLLAVYMR